MTYYLNFRGSSIGGPVIDPYMLEGDGTTDPPSLSVVEWPRVRALTSGANLLFVAHGFNVQYQFGACSLGLLERDMRLTPPNLFIGVLWPGDARIPVVDYPLEGDVAIQCGHRLAAFCERWCAQAQAISFASHSLGARLILQAISDLKDSRRVNMACLTAGAINHDCLGSEYSAAAKNSNTIFALASRRDDVLKLAFPLGDPVADLLHDDHTPFQRAFGYEGPRTPAPVLGPWQISDEADYGHGDYLPKCPVDQSPDAKWMKVSAFIKNAFFGRAQPWPSGDTGTE